MKITRMLFGERSLTKVAALFADKSQAQSVAQGARQVAGLDDPQVYLVGSPDGAALDSPAFSRKLEPEQGGIWRTVIRAHAIAGTVGVVAGVLAYVGFVLADSAAVRSTPWMSLVAMVLFGGLLTVRPDHAFVITTVRRAIRRGRWALVIHPLTQRQLDLSMGELRSRSDRVVRSL